jgi:hypothetical protein
MGTRITGFLEAIASHSSRLTAPIGSRIYELLISLRKESRQLPNFGFLAKHAQLDRPVHLRWVSPPATAELANLQSVWSLLSASADQKESNAAQIAFAGGRRFETDLAFGSVAGSFAEFADRVAANSSEEVVGMMVVEAAWLPHEWLGFCIIRRPYGENLFLDFLSTNPLAGNRVRITLLGAGMLYVVSQIVTAIKAKYLHIESTAHSAGFYSNVFSVRPANLLKLRACRVRYAFRNFG